MSLQPIWFVMLLTALASCQQNHSELKGDQRVEVTLDIFDDQPGQGMILRQWPTNGSVIRQQVKTDPQRGGIWDITGINSNPGVAHIQFKEGSRNLTDFAEGRLEFDLKVVNASTNSKMLVKLDGGYPRLATAQIDLQNLTAEEPAESIQAEISDECRQRESTIRQAEKFGELDILRQSADPLMASCIDVVMKRPQSGTDSTPIPNTNSANSTNWRHVSLNLDDFQVTEGFDLSLVKDPFVLEFPEQGEFHVQLDNIKLVRQVTPIDQDKPLPKVPTTADSKGIGDQSTTGKMVGDVAVTKGTIRVRRRHENDLDFSKYNPFYWSGRLVKFTIEDFTPANQNKLRFTLETEKPNIVGRVGHWPVASWIYIGDPNGADETLRSKFYQDVDLKPVGDSKTKFQYEWNANMNDPKIAAAMQKGKMMTVEFRVFLDKEDPFFARQKEINPHTLFNYYSEFFRTKIGSPGLYIDNLSNKDQFASTKRYAGGWTTTPTVRVEPWRGIQQQATNIIPENSSDFLLGRTWFHTDFIAGKHTRDDEDDKPVILTPEMTAERRGISGTAYNITACNRCHIDNGISLLPDIGKPIHTTIAKTMQANGQPHPGFGHQLQTQGKDKEGDLQIERYETRVETLADGSTVILRKPVFKVMSATDTSDLALSVRKPQALIGLGLLNAIDDSTIKKLARESEGEVNMVNGKIGRFGWKATQTDLTDQIVKALKNDMAVLSGNETELDCAGCGSGKRLDPEAVEKLEAYVSLLGVPPRNYPESPEVVRGEEVFEQLNCHSCHVTSLKTKANADFAELSDQVIHPYIDLLLHDMGPGLADDSGGELAAKWRTAPLWGLKNVRNATKVQHVRGTTVSMSETWPVAEQNSLHLLHDGRARSIEEAILWHGGEAKQSVEEYKKLPLADRNALEAFLLDL